MLSGRCGSKNGTIPTPWGTNGQSSSHPLVAVTPADLVWVCTYSTDFTSPTTAVVCLIAMIKLYLEAGGPLTISFQATSWPNVKPSLGVLLSRPPGQGTGGLIEWNLRSNCVELELNSNSQIKGIGETTMFPFPGDRGVDWMKSQIKLDWYWIELPIIMNSFQFEWKSRSWNIPFFQNDTVWPIYGI